MQIMRILLGITGCIAAYKTPELVRLLRKAGHEVRCMLSDNGARLVAKDALATVSGNPVATSIWRDDASIPHIQLARWGEALLVAPATANTLASFAHGHADDLISTTLLAFEPEKPVWLAPAMNTVMWRKAAVQRNLALLREEGLRVLGPVAGDLACGEDGEGAMIAPADIVAAISGDA